MKGGRFFGGGRRLRTLRKPFCRSSLPSLEGVYVWISRVEGDAAREGLDRDRVKAEVECRLVAAGIPVLHQNKRGGAPATPCLGVQLHLRKADVIPACYFFSVEVFFIQTTSEDDPADRSLRMTWCKEAIGDVPTTPQGPDWSGVYAHIGSLVEAFISNYLSVNSRANPALLIN
jgi:hypothetical protein